MPSEAAGPVADTVTPILTSACACTLQKLAIRQAAYIGFKTDDKIGFMLMVRV
jgi:hypothetical protein